MIGLTFDLNFCHSSPWLKEIVTDVVQLLWFLSEKEDLCHNRLRNNVVDICKILRSKKEGRSELKTEERK
jgi:hypothetical protein